MVDGSLSVNQYQVGLSKKLLRKFRFEIDGKGGNQLCVDAAQLFTHSLADELATEMWVEETGVVDQDDFYGFERIHDRMNNRNSRLVSIRNGSSKRCIEVLSLRIIIRDSK